MSSPSASPTFNVTDIREHARGSWRSIFEVLGIDVGTGKHRHCPVCGGKDRFRFDDKDGGGTWFCNQCDPHAGDGFALVMNVCGCAFPEALRLVTDVLGLTPSSHKPHRHPAPKPIPVDRVKLAFKLDMAALDRQLRAKRIFEAAKSLDVSDLSEAELNRALNTVAKVHEDETRAELFAHVADTLREREYNERTHRERQERVA